MLDAAKNRLGQNVAPLLDHLAKCGAVNLDWYLQKKIVDVGDAESERDNGRVLKYAYNFSLNGAKVTFVQESSDSGVKTPDLKVEWRQYRFFLEVKKFRMTLHKGSNPVLKIVEAVTTKRAQLSTSEVGFVAIDSFDLGLEKDAKGGLSHEHITEALCELDRLSAENPGGWEKPSGVIIAASTTGGVITVSDGAPLAIEIPHFVWTNEHSRPSVPGRLAKWISSSLPNGEIFNAAPRAIA